MIGAKVEIQLEITTGYNRLYLPRENNYFPQQYSFEINNKFIKQIYPLTQRITINNHHFHTQFPNYQDFKIFPIMLRILQKFPCAPKFG